MGAVAFSANHFHSTDWMTSRDHILSNSGLQRFEIDLCSGFSSFNHRSSSLGGLTIEAMELECRDAFRVRKVERPTFHSFHFVVKGACHVTSSRQSFTATAGNLFVLQPNQEAQEHWAEGCEQFIVRIDKSEIEKAVQKMLGHQPSNEIIFKHMSTDPGIADWIGQLSLLPQNSLAGRSGLFENKHVAFHLEQSLIMMLLSEIEHSCSAEMSHENHGPAPYYVKRVEDMFRANFENEISMADILQVSGVSLRTVFYGFQRWRGTTPMGYLRDMRLDAARQYLAKPVAGPKSVSEAALAAGFTNFSQFSKLYKMRFGEKPSATLVESRH
jgi:AraC-like DNA-binding protein